MKYIIPILAFLLFSVTNIFAQEQNKTQVQAQVQAQPTPLIAPTKTTATFLGGLVFAPRLHYFGRTDSLKSNALLPTFTVQFDSVGLYGSGTAVFLSNTIQSLQYAGTIVEAGYRFGKQKGLTGNFYGNKFFYNTTQLPQSAFQEQVGANFNYLMKAFNISATGSSAFSKERTDFFASTGVNKFFKKKLKNAVFLVSPTYVLNAGSQNFTNVRMRAGLLGGVTGMSQQTIEKNRTFKILSHEISIPLIYARKHIYFIITPSYVIPENIVTIPNRPDLSEYAKNLFYANATILYSFKK